MTFTREFQIYVARTRQFERDDWRVYIAWVGLMLGLVVSTATFLLYGSRLGVVFPPEAWLVPSGAAIFALSISVDTIGHRTIYKREIAKAEGLVHGITIACGIGSCVLLCAAYSPTTRFLWIPAMVLTVLSFVYSLLDEALHWRRYMSAQSDRVEMWSHVGIFVGHGVMMLAWWTWFFTGYTGVAETAARL